MRAVVIKTVGNVEMAAPIAEALGKSVIPLNTREMEAVMAENRRLNAINGVRAEGDDKRWERTRRRLARKYAIKTHGRAYTLALLAWAMIWMEIVEWYRYYAAWNRGA